MRTNRTVVSRVIATAALVLVVVSYGTYLAIG
jgi:hypothetical protein